MSSLIFSPHLTQTRFWQNWMWKDHKVQKRKKEKNQERSRKIETFFFKFIFQLQLTYNIILVSGVQHID